MKKKRFSMEQIVGVLKQSQVGVPVAEVIRKAGISEQTFYRWKAKYAGLEVDDDVERCNVEGGTSNWKCLRSAMLAARA
jgi:DNA invertase Pin-like site-specific DNA recombinase